jgi:hypothetical protein
LLQIIQRFHAPMAHSRSGSVGGSDKVGLRKAGPKHTWRVPHESCLRLTHLRATSQSLPCLPQGYERARPYSGHSSGQRVLFRPGRVVPFLCGRSRHDHARHFRIEPTDAISANDKVATIEDMSLDEIQHSATRGRFRLHHVELEGGGAAPSPARSSITPPIAHVRFLSNDRNS